MTRMTKAEKEIMSVPERALHRWATRALISHRRRNLEVKLTIEELKWIAKQTKTCPLCGVQLIYWRKSYLWWQHGSLDRKDNGNTITKDNAWVICLKCNAMKSDKTFSEFVKYCKRVADTYWEEINEAEQHELDVKRREFMQRVFAPPSEEEYAAMSPERRKYMRIFNEVPTVDWSKEKRRTNTKQEAPKA